MKTSNLSNHSSGLNYNPLGMLLVDRNWAAGSEYKYGFNGKESDDEIAGNNNTLDFGARIYDARLGRWLSTDPLMKEYAFASPYCFVLNTPLQAIDPDGKLVVFVNGFRLRAYLWDGSVPWEHKEKIYNNDKFDYWYGNDASGARSNNTSDRLDYKFKKRFGDYNSVYVDGAYKPQSSAQNRYDRGIEDAKVLIKKINTGEIILAQDETIKVVGHSMGGLHAKGMADYLAQQGYDVEGLYALRPHQPNQKVKLLSNVANYFAAQYSIKSDHVSSDQSKLLGPGAALAGDSQFGKMQGTDAMPKLTEMPNAPRGGHNLQDTGNIFDIISGGDGYVRPDGYCPKEGDCD